MHSTIKIPDPVSSPGCYLTEEHSKDKEHIQMKETLQNGKASQPV